MREVTDRKVFHAHNLWLAAGGIFLGALSVGAHINHHGRDVIVIVTEILSVACLMFARLTIVADSEKVVVQSSLLAWRHAKIDIDRIASVSIYMGMRPRKYVEWRSGPSSKKFFGRDVIAINRLGAIHLDLKEGGTFTFSCNDLDALRHISMLVEAKSSAV